MKLIIPLHIKMIVLFWIMTELFIWITRFLATPTWWSVNVDADDAKSLWLMLIGICVLISKILILPFLWWVAMIVFGDV